VNGELDGYWRGDFTLGPDREEDRDEGLDEGRPGDRHEGRQGGRQGAAAPFPIEQLAAPEITVRGRNLAALLAPVYRVLGS
jgi:hypothetical protein